jgi:hypothetical protein
MGPLFRALLDHGIDLAVAVAMSAPVCHCVFCLVCQRRLRLARHSSEQKATFGFQAAQRGAAPHRLQPRLERMASRCPVRIRGLAPVRGPEGWPPLMMEPTDGLEQIFRGSKWCPSEEIVPRLYPHRTGQLRALPGSPITFLTSRSAPHRNE